MFRNLNGILILSILLLFKYFFLSLFIDFELFTYRDAIEDVFFLMIIILLVNNPFIKKQYFTDIVFIVYLLYLVMEGTSYLAVSSNFSSSYMYLLIEASKHELHEFGLAYLSVSIVIYIAIITSMYFLMRKRIINKPSSDKPIFGWIAILIIGIGLKLTGYIESNAYHNIVRGFYGYVELQNSTSLKTDLPIEEVEVTANNEVFVVVLGESTARGKLQLYGHGRETTPFLSSIEQDLFVYSDVISTEVFTFKAMPKIITSLGGIPEKESLINLVQLFNTAGYNTYWLSNQRPISYHDNVVSRIASQAKEFKFYNHLIDEHAQVLDEVIFPDYDRILKEPGKKVIFIRLIGTHFKYKNRYPNSFNKFAKSTDVSKVELIKNQYDNAVLYNDFIVYNLIIKLKSTTSKSALIYTSDHGENVYDDGTDFFGRSEEVLTPSMFEIPFVFWASKNFDFPTDFTYNSNRKFVADHTYESVGHIFGVKHKNMDFSKSIFSNSFKERKRIVIGNIDFDSYFVDEKKH